MGRHWYWKRSNQRSDSKLTARRLCLRGCGRLIVLNGKEGNGFWIITNFEGGPVHKCRGNSRTIKDVAKENARILLT